MNKYEKDTLCFLYLKNIHSLQKLNYSKGPILDENLDTSKNAR